MLPGPVVDDVPHPRGAHLQVGQRVQDADGSLESLEKGFAAVANARVVKGAEEYYRWA